MPVSMVSVYVVPPISSVESVSFVASTVKDVGALPSLVICTEAMVTLSASSEVSFGSVVSRRVNAKSTLISTLNVSSASTAV